MNVLMISGDHRLLEAGSSAYERLQLQRAHVERLDVFVWPQVHSWRAMCEAVKAGQYDVVTSQDPFWRGLLAWRVARIAGAKLNLQLHADLAGQSLLKRLLARIVLPHADSVRVVSEKIKTQVEHLGVRAKIHVLPICIDLERFRAAVCRDHTQKTILWIGRFEEEKNPLEAIEVLQKVREAGVEAKLVMLGSGSLESALRRQANGLPVEFPGWQEPVSFLEVADVVLSTSHHESYGASIIEALAAGVPVVAPDVGSAREAGAVVVAHAALAEAVTQTLLSRARGVLRLELPDAPGWAKQWRASLI